jgi:hypothetical protein
MEIVLLAVTVVSLVVAFVMSITAWRQAKENRERSASRVAALVAAAEDRNAVPEPVAERPIARPVERPGEPIAINDARPALWRSPAPAVAQERAAFRRSLPADLPLAHAAGPDLGDTFLGSAVKPASGGGQRRLAMAAAVLFVGLVTTGYFLVFGGDSGSTATTEQAVPTAHPLELVSLGHQRRNSSLALSGLVRNPRNGEPLEQLTAVAFLFDREGRFVTSAKADVDFRKLTPGDESPFVITLDAPSTVARYRVSFRTEAGVVPHVDRRGQEPIARELP